ncbi:MAG TPA: hypothetical protein VIH70_03090, partial [Actinomycetota bacterium]
MTEGVQGGSSNERSEAAADPLAREASHRWRNASEETEGKAAYRQSGVDVQAGRRAVELIRDMAHAARRPEVVGAVGD